MISNENEASNKTNLESTNSTPSPENQYGYSGYSGPLPTPADPPTPTKGIDLTVFRRTYGSHYGTSGYGLINTPPDVNLEDTLEVMNWFNECSKLDGDPKKHMDQGVKIIEESFADYNSLKHLFGQYDAKWAIKLGEFLIIQKILVRKAELEWGEWAAQNLPFIGKRTREKFMNLAKRKDCHQYSFLGVDRLDVLCSATKENDQGNDRIGAFMTKYKILFDPTKEFDPQEFKLQIDTALNQEKLMKHDLPADSAYVRDLTAAGKEINGSVIKKMKDVRECGGDPTAYLKNLTATAGKESKGDDDDKTIVSDFNTLSNRLIRTIDYLIKDKEDEIVMVDAGTFVKLLKKLKTLHKLTSINIEPAQAA